MAETLTRVFRNDAVPPGRTHGPIVSGAMAWIKPLGTRLTAPGHNRCPSGSIRRIEEIAPGACAAMVRPNASRGRRASLTARWLGRCRAIAARTTGRTQAFPTARRVARRLLSDGRDD